MDVLVWHALRHGDEHGRGTAAHITLLVFGGGQSLCTSLYKDALTTHHDVGLQRANCVQTHTGPTGLGQQCCQCCHCCCCCFMDGRVLVLEAGGCKGVCFLEGVCCIATDIVPPCIACVDIW